ncbi:MULTISPECIES: DUF2989 domain-containing protein [unclassified Pseudoalteromonas]|uniref:DUF2989 domain-containing protein n=1 Tax=unclassified Pseudoalteromonas TaxID=194690 RepID=UPI0015FFC318|nr:MULTISPECIES: DUF2989 domain-containing protein [unclassified Pseudoalteromonas]MBB1334374.1 DUF2989 domain-containing protein [Pseudoalteromonas sp. SR41-6]MBB1342138.1 DUF2989 domain-containing protein [Pseudoalteromonas sp. SR45-6]MBB1418106.1 DUF2989 domain-containing protein [Pseudoalteromonas sp. SG44-1]MBB1435336.1 DUF2989 domain-containing protein [Pseudoalteromonas sp. SG43-6]MBB1459914.1 DUF2989 domain-containing protein [Pseudoalteromonas sp. SG41-8]
MLLRASVLLSLLALTGCEEPLTLAKVCKETPGLCNDLNTDSHCKAQRADVIMARYHEYKQPTDDNKYLLLKGFEKYDRCVSLAAKIEHIKLKEKTTSRVEAHLTSIKEMTRLFQDTKNTNHPGLLYYHWSRNNDQSALTKLLALEKDPSVTEDAEIQFFLASYYIKFDEDKTIDLLYKTLELNKAEQTPNPEIFTTLTSLFYKQEKYKHAYTFAKIAQLSGITNVEIFPIEQQLTATGKSLSGLDTLAQQTYDSIQAGQFVSPRDF